MKTLTKINPKWLLALVLLVLTGYLTLSFINMERPKGLRIYAPAMNSSADKTGSASVNSQTFARIDPVAFSAAFGLDYQKKIEAKPEKVEDKKPEPVKVENKLVEEIAPKTIDLGAIGYRLKGIILEKDGNSAAFVYDPNSKKTLVVREKADGEISIVSATMRSVRLQTPDGEGELELEDSKGQKGGSNTFLKPYGAATSSPQSAAKAIKNEKLLRQTDTSANSIAGMISAGHFQVRPERGSFQVEVRQVPDSFAGYGLRPGDKIIGTTQGDFKQSQDVALQLGKISDRPEPLKIQRGRRTMYLSPPPRPAKAPEQAKTQDPAKAPGAAKPPVLGKK